VNAPRPVVEFLVGARRMEADSLVQMATILAGIGLNDATVVQLRVSPETPWEFHPWSEIRTDWQSGLLASCDAENSREVQS